MNKVFFYIILIYFTSVTVWGESSTQASKSSSVSPLLKVESKTEKRPSPKTELRMSETQELDKEILSGQILNTQSPVAQRPITQTPVAHRPKVQKISTYVMDHKLLRRLVVFPFKIDISYKAAAEDAWWNVRSELTENQRFLVASKNFMISKDVFQRRAELDIPDTLILGKLLNAQALVVTIVKDRQMKMLVYDGEFGGLLWQHEILLNNLTPIARQLKTESKKLIKDFIASIPYQGFVRKKDFEKSAVFERNNHFYFKGYFSDVRYVTLGDKVNVVKVIKNNFSPLFVQLNSVTIIATGVVSNIQKNIVEIELQRAVDANKIIQGDLLNVSKEYKRLRNSLESERNKQLEDAVFDPNIKNVQKQDEETRPLVSALTFLGTLAIFLLLAF